MIWREINCFIGVRKHQIKQLFSITKLTDYFMWVGEEEIKVAFWYHEIKEDFIGVRRQQNKRLSSITKLSD